VDVSSVICSEEAGVASAATRTPGWTAAWSLAYPE
jgi:hypothetical protein